MTTPPTNAERSPDQQIADLLAKVFREHHDVDWLHETTRIVRVLHDADALKRCDFLEAWWDGSKVETFKCHLLAGHDRAHQDGARTWVDAVDVEPAAAESAPETNKPYAIRSRDFNSAIHEAQDVVTYDPLRGLKAAVWNSFKPPVPESAFIIVRDKPKLPTLEDILSEHWMFTNITHDCTGCGERLDPTIDIDDAHRAHVGDAIREYFTVTPKADP